MEKTTIQWNGKSYPARIIKLSEKTANEYDEHDEVVVSVESLWDDIETAYYQNNGDAIGIDDGVFFYVEDSFMAGEPSEVEMQEYLEECL